MVATSPNLGIEDWGAAESGLRRARAAAPRVRAITWPGNRGSIDLPLALGFEVEAGRSQNLYGTPSQAAYDFAGGPDALLGALTGPHEVGARY